ncbi:2-hydroxychromene-2-carboxylate isomerase [Streptomyces scopuliridis]|uniref:2-hydroxychromene-2-carboxylate isomerase n=1 Tax=Streptomyces scopuliridis RB72 TaxID=1440053 RepID=A0A2T7TGB9_9ACTN|nr:DsbA family protein [Streptomyces scopuliridis]PVE14137.1 isomerase [Streptomyces scopuliridis RB72]
MAKKPPRWYFSLRSPYSWFAYRDLTKHHPDVLAAVQWIPFWEPDAHSRELLARMGVELPLVPMAREKNFYILQDTRRLAEDRGLEVTWPLDREPVWEVSHLAYLVAEDAGKGKEFVDAVYRARWQESKNISSPAVIGEIAAELGLDADRAAGAADDPDLRARGVGILAASAKDGLFGVPFFIHGHDKFWGVDRVDAFVAALRGVPRDAVALSDAELAALPATAEAGGDAGHAGGCG